MRPKSEKIELTNSTRLKSMEYNYELCVLTLEFIKGGLYTYTLFMGDAWVELKRADSKGKFFEENIRNNKSYIVKKI